MARRVDPVKHQARRQQIIDAAAGLFATKGLDGTSTADICKAAGMSPGNLFHYFPSKREIFFAVITHDEAEKERHLAAALASTDPLSALQDVVDYLLGPATVPMAPPLVMEAVLQARRDPELAEWLSRDRADEQATIEELVSRAVQAGQIDPGVEPRDAAEWIATLVGAVYLQAATDPEFPVARHLRTMHLTLRRFLRADAAGSARPGP